MAVVAAARQVHREEAFALGRSVMLGTTAVPLRARACHRLEAEQVEYLGHGDLGTETVEVDTWHDVVLLNADRLMAVGVVPFPFSL